MRQRSKLACCLAVAVLFAYASVCGAAASQSRNGQVQSSSDSAQSCLKAAKELLGPTASVLKCGHLAESNALEVVAGAKLAQFKETRDSVLVSKLAVLRLNGSAWNAELTADKNWMRNNIGYVGLEFVDDSFQIYGYRVSFSDHRSDDVTDFTIWLQYLNGDGTAEGISTEISWNPSVGRFQEFAYGEDPESFRPEVINPRHIRQRKTR
jgi:hypothetical protein